MFSRTQSQIRDLNKIDEFKIDDRGCYLMAGKNTFGQLAWNEVEEVFHAGSGYDLHLIFKLKKGSKKVAWPDGLHILPRQAKYSGGDIFLGDVFEESILVVAKKCEEKRAQINDSDQKISNPKDIN